MLCDEFYLHEFCIVMVHVFVMNVLIDGLVLISSSIST
jgi:hypothetical protein